jgi:hypothetical protein
MGKRLQKLVAYLDARDVFVLIGFGFLFWGLSAYFCVPIAAIVTGAIILIKGLVKWV